MCDLGRLDDPAVRAFAEVAGVRVVVMRRCYLGLRRAVRHPAITQAVGAIVIDEHGHHSAPDVEDVLGVAGHRDDPARTSIARAVDAGVLPTRLPDSLGRPLHHALLQVGCFDDEQAA